MDSDPNLGKTIAQQILDRLQEMGLGAMELPTIPLFRKRLIHEGKILVVNRTHGTPIMYFLDPQAHPDLFKI